MNIHVRIATTLLVLGLLAAVGYRHAWPVVQERLQRLSTDARDTKGRIVIGVDSWVGYFPLCSPELRKRMRVQGYVVLCEDDRADYAKRLERLRGGQLQFAVASVDAYLANGAAQAFPGAIVAVLDESKGGDAVVAWKDKAVSVQALKSTPAPRIAFTPGSPSEHLLRALAVHFDVPGLRAGAPSQWRVETTGSAEALKALQEKRSDVAVLWEPDVSRALALDGTVKLLSTAQTQRLIVDVLLASRNVLQHDPDMVRTLLAVYFEVLRHYRDQPAQLAQDVALETRLDAGSVQSMLAGVAWASLGDNAQTWMGATPGSHALVDVISSSLRILLESGALPADPLPDRDPFRILASQFVTAQYMAATTGSAGVASAGAGLEQRFAPLSEAQWQGLREVGSLKALQVGFQSGTAELGLEGKAEIDQMMEVLRHYPSFRLRVRGHTALGGDAEENQRLSRERAESVARYLGVTYNLDPNRSQVLGMGASQPLARLPAETDRAYQYRLPRVEVTLLSEAL